MIGLESNLTGNFSDSLDQFSADIKEKVLFSGVSAMARIIQDEAIFQAGKHRKSGRLVNSIYRVYSEEKSTDAIKVYRVSWNKTKAPHGHLIEFGTSHAPAYPFIRPAFDRVGEAIEEGKNRMAQKLDEIKHES